MQSPFTRFKARFIIFDFVLISIGIYIILVLISLLFGLKFASDNEIVTYVFYCSAMLSVCFTTFWRLKNHRIEPKQLIGKTSISNIPWLLVFIVFYAQESIINGFSYLTIFITNIFSPDLLKSTLEQLKIDFSYEAQSLLLKILYFLLVTFSVVIIAPLTEEFIFRGVLLHRLAAKGGIKAAIIGSSILFGLAHLDIFFMERAIGGAIQSLLYINTGMLVIPILVHAMHNAFVFINGIVLNFSESTTEDKISIAYLWYGLFNIVIPLPVLFYFLKWPSTLASLPYNTNSKSCE